MTTLCVYFCCDTQNGFDFASLHPLSPRFPPRTTQVPIIAPQKYPATLLCSDTHLDRLKGLFLPLLCCSSIFFLHFLAPCLSVSTFSLSPLPSCFPFITIQHVLSPSHLCVCLLSLSLSVCCWCCFFVAATTSLLS